MSSKTCLECGENLDTPAQIIFHKCDQEQEKTLKELFGDLY